MANDEDEQTPGQSKEQATEQAADEQTHEEAAQEMREFEKSDEVPSDLSDWPSGKAKYVTFGEDSDDAYGEGPTAKLGPAEVQHHEDGSVTVAGEDADADDYKGEPIKSGVVEQIEESKQAYRKMQRENPDLEDPKEDDDEGGEKQEEQEEQAG
jgi:hypothetical protein